MTLGPLITQEHLPCQDAYSCLRSVATEESTVTASRDQVGNVPGAVVPPGTAMWGQGGGCQSNRIPRHQLLLLLGQVAAG